MVAFTKLATLAALGLLSIAVAMPSDISVRDPNYSKLKIYFRRYINNVKCDVGTSIGRRPWFTSDGGADVLRQEHCKDWANAVPFTNFWYTRTNSGVWPSPFCRIIVYEGHHCKGEQYTLGRFYHNENVCGGDYGFAAHSVYVTCRVGNIEGEKRPPPEDDVQPPPAPDPWAGMSVVPEIDYNDGPENLPMMHLAIPPVEY